MHTAPLADPNPRLADLLAERPPALEARRLLTYVCAVARRPPLDQDLVTGMTARCHAEAVQASVANALAARSPEAALAAVEHARRSLLTLRAVLAVAVGEGTLHVVQFRILAQQLTRSREALGELARRARELAGRDRGGRGSPLDTGRHPAGQGGYPWAT